jgi:hypothetical protein
MYILSSTFLINFYTIGCESSDYTCASQAKNPNRHFNLKVGGIICKIYQIAARRSHPRIVNVIVAVQRMYKSK